MILYQLSRPFAYLSIKNHPSKKVFDWIFPAIISITLMVMLSPFWSDINFYGNDGLISKLMTFCQTLPGFFLAALSVIATFSKVDIDQLLPAPTPKIKVEVRGTVNEIELTRRRFLCMLFSFLTFESLILAILPLFILAIAPAASKIIAEGWNTLAAITFIFVYLFTFFQMLTATMLGLYYLGDRLHQPNI
ncbi:hypothetical protein [Agitococcus lubricus]|uniref:Uncharacterized protein n=1 Tax=Agitococcus lubricus TaxID=1077255 RepID=A0A2T5J1E4_9GAMM|nr:hypothetical protein [Agitococcus lubricus]PTQ90265.1 hypothetical protein C8N29_10318 [Agitococcus lubricus]